MIGLHHDDRIACNTTGADTYCCQAVALIPAVSARVLGLIFGDGQSNISIA